MTEPGSVGKGKIDDETKAKVKYDRQIIGIAKVHQADAIYSDDRGLRTKAEAEGIRVIGLLEIALPPEEPQSKFPFEGQTKDE